MLFLVRFTDRPDSYPLRQRLLEAHIDWCARHRESVLVAGSLRVEPDAAPIGGAWVVEAQSKAAVEALMQTDPFWTGGLRAGVEILHWSKALAEKALV